jgi:PKD repeat protein
MGGGAAGGGDGSEGRDGATSRRAVLRTAAAGAGVTLAPSGGAAGVAGAQTAAAPELPPLRDAFLLARDDGGIDWGLLFAADVQDVRGDLAGEDLFSFPDASPDRVAVDPRPVEWGNRYVTSRSAGEFARAIGQGGLADEARSVDTTGDVFGRSEPATLGFYNAPGTDGDTFAERHSVTGTVDGLLTPRTELSPDRPLRVPAVAYTGGSYADPAVDGSVASPPPGTAHLQLYDGYTHTLPGRFTSGYTRELGRYRGRASALYSPVPLSGGDRLVPSFAHRSNPALAVLNSNALGRARVFANVHEFVNRETSAIRREALRRSVTSIVNGATRVGPGVPFGEDRYVETAVATANLLLPVATAAVGGVIFGPPGFVAGAFVGEALGTALDAFNVVTSDARALSAFTDWDVLGDVRTNVVLEPLRASTSGNPTPLELSAVASLQADAGTRALAAGGDGAAFRAYADLLDAQYAALGSYEAAFDGEAITLAPPELEPFVSAFGSYVSAQRRAVDRERRLLRSVNLSRTGVRFTETPARPPETGESVRLEVAADDPPAGRVAGYRWRFDRRADEASASGGGGTELTDEPSTTRTFAEPGTYAVEASPRVENAPGAGGGTTTASLGARTEVEVAAEVLAAVDIPNYEGGTLPVGEAVRFDGSGSASLAAGESVRRYDWYAIPEVDAPDGAVRPGGGLGDPDATGERPFLTFDAADTYTVLLVVEDTRGRTASARTTVTAFGEEAVVARVDLPAEPIPVGEPVTFDGSNSLSAFEGGMDRYEWTVTDSFGADGSVGEGRLGEGAGATFTFAFEERPAGGAATVNLTVADRVDAPAAYTDLQRRTVQVVGSADGPDDDGEDGGDDDGTGPEIDVRFDTEETHEADVGASVSMSVARVPGEVIRRTEWQTQPRDDPFPVERTEATGVRGRRFAETFDEAGAWDVRVVVETNRGSYAETEILWVVDVDFDETADRDGDGRREDVNGNGELDFDDVVALDANLEAEELETEASSFDFDGDGDGDLDADDVEALFDLVRDATGSD